MPLLSVDGCHNYTVLSEADRAQGYIVINASNYRSDYSDLVPGWHRFLGAAGDRMADKCVPMDHCGTRHPGWLNGTHPTVAEGAVIRRVCFNISNNCCYWYQDIRVKNCGAYFVYALPTRYHYYYYYYFRYCGNGRAGKILRMFLIILLSKVRRYFTISSNATVKDALIDVNIGFQL